MFAATPEEPDFSTECKWSENLGNGGAQAASYWVMPAGGLPTTFELFLLAPLFLSWLAQVTELAVRAVAAALRVRESAWLAVSRAVAGRAHGRQLR